MAEANKPKICISIVSGGSVRTDTVACLIDSLGHLHPTEVEKYLYMPVGGYVELNRNMTIKQALQNGATHIMFIDHDMIFPGDGIKKLLEADKDVILANYNARGVVSREKNIVEIASTLKIGKKGDYKKMDPEQLPKDKLFKVAAGGTGFMMIKTEVFKKLPYPWFVAAEIEGSWTTEDIYFCELLQEHGFEIWCDPTIKMGHIGTYVY